MQFYKRYSRPNPPSTGHQSIAASIGDRERRIVMNTTGEMVETNMGLIPLEDYQDIVAWQYGYDSYEEMKKDGWNF